MDPRGGKGFSGTAGLRKLSVRPSIVWLSVALLACASCSPAAHDPSVQIDTLMRPYQGAVPGASVLVVRDGLPVIRRAYGLANLEAGSPAIAASNYRLASMTKQFTAASILLLAEDGRLTLQDPGTTQQLHDADVLHLLEAENRTYFAPGTQYRYSNSGYSLLALIVGRCSGKDFATFLRERIFKPLHMQNTVAFEEGVSTVANRAYGYSLVNNSWTRTDQSLTSAVLGHREGIFADGRRCARRPFGERS
jgi:CubicO group peptidase (beta-lactamase class C family)